MSKAAVDLPPKGGFSFDLCQRNERSSHFSLLSESYAFPLLIAVFSFLYDTVDGERMGREGVGGSVVAL